MEDKYSKFVENYTLPDGTPMELANEKNKAPEILFNPEKIGLEYPCMHKHIYLFFIFVEDIFIKSFLKNSRIRIVYKLHLKD